MNSIKHLRNINFTQTLLSNRKGYTSQQRHENESSFLNQYLSWIDAQALSKMVAVECSNIWKETISSPSIVYSKKINLTFTDLIYLVNILRGKKRHDFLNKAEKIMHPW